MKATVWIFNPASVSAEETLWYTCKHKENFDSVPLAYSKKAH